MKLPWFITRGLLDHALHVALHRAPDFTIRGTEEGDYLRRWFLTPWSKWDRTVPPKNWIEALKRRLPNVYVHKFLRSDDDGALHDHPWWNVSVLLMGKYVEETVAEGGVHHRREYRAGDLKFRRATGAHRIEVEMPCWTIFITGPAVRDWGFHCANGWRPWQQFVDARDRGKTGHGCG